MITPARKPRLVTGAVKNGNEIMKLEEIFEVTVIGQSHSEPLKENDTVRVYHGTSDADTVLAAVTRGISGGSRVSRTYSYENNNNPRGLFVTPDIKTAKDFGSYVLEFQTRVSDLEAPVWPSGTFTVQGQMSGVFDTEDDREVERLRQRMNWSESEFEFVRNSDRPELAALFLVSGERQALFTGDLNANSIRAVWTSPDPTRIGQTYTRMSPRDFVRMAESQDGIPSRFGGRRGGLEKDSRAAQDSKGKLVNPRDDVSAEQLVDLMQQVYRTIPRDRIIKVMQDNPDTIRKRVWNDRQFNQVQQGLRFVR